MRLRAPLPNRMVACPPCRHRRVSLFAMYICNSPSTWTHRAIDVDINLFVACCSVGSCQRCVLYINAHTSRLLTSVSSNRYTESLPETKPWRQTYRIGNKSMSISTGNAIRSRAAVAEECVPIGQDSAKTASAAECCNRCRCWCR